MKEYGKLIIWIDYFNSAIKRSEGRRVPLRSAVRDPTLDDLMGATKRLGYSPESQEAYYPKRDKVRSGYVSVEKKESKMVTVNKVARILGQIKGEKKSSTGKKGR
ncbi:MAG: signal recognition particle subunit SRP19/SEC65 family protein [Nitrososphaerales archaeon]